GKKSERALKLFVNYEGLPLISLALVLFLRFVSYSFSFLPQATMAVRNVLLTGCSSGIGLALAVRLARDELKRFRVFATMRNLEKSEALKEQAGPALDKMLEIKELDVTSEDSIRRCVNSIPQRRVDVLVNNAGFGLIGPVESQSMASIQHLFDTNFFGLVRLVQEIFPDMKRRKRGILL
ncbi:hypothetical protein E2320_016858, partial [Naja naja]